MRQFSEHVLAASKSALKSLVFITFVEDNDPPSIVLFFLLGSDFRRKVLYENFRS